MGLHLDRISSNFFITNFPLDLKSRDLWLWCKKFGNVVDVYIANKTSKRGRRFGFIRFISIGNEEVFARSLSKEWMGSYHIFVSVARFKREKPKSSDVPNERVVGNVGSRGSQSYAKVVIGEGESLEGQDQKGSIKKITLQQQDLLQLDVSSEVVLAKVRDASLLPNLYKALLNEGFCNLSIKHVGGLWVWIEFNNQKACMAFKKRSSLKELFVGIKPVSRSFVIEERVVWIEFEGLPLCAWSANAFKKVAEGWGKFICFDKEEDESVSCGRVCISTTSPDLIFEKAVVAVEGIEYVIRVREIAPWSVEISELDDSQESEELNSGSEEDEEDGDEEESQRKLEGFNDIMVQDNLSVAEISPEKKGEEEEIISVTEVELQQEKQMKGSQTKTAIPESETASFPPGFEQLKENIKDLENTDSTIPEVEKEGGEASSATAFFGDAL